jgi:hypothetical protein
MKVTIPIPLVIQEEIPTLSDIFFTDGDVNASYSTYTGGDSYSTCIHRWREISTRTTTHSQAEIPTFTDILYRQRFQRKLQHLQVVKDGDFNARNKNISVGDSYFS